MSLEQVGRYKLLKKIAMGGMAEIFLAEQSGPGHFRKRLVIKRILPHLLDNEKFLQMFKDEARVAAMMNHQNIVQIFELGEENGSYYIAMEYVPGFNLRAVIRLAHKNNIWLAPEYIARLGSEICQGLEYAHNFCDPDGNHLNLIHRDVSPQNIILSKQGVIKIVDFGIAKASSNDQETQAGIIKGKLAYMSPEQVKGKVLDRRSDLFSLGIVLYELATHQRPYQGNTEIEMLRAILDATPRPLGNFRSEFPDELTQIIYKALAKERNDRYQSAREMQWDLENFLRSWGKPVTSFQLQELISDLEGLEKGTEAKEGSGAKPPPEALKAEASPPPPPPIPSATPLASSRTSAAAIVSASATPVATLPPPVLKPTAQEAQPAEAPKVPATPSDFGEDETMWAQDVSLPPPPAGQNAPSFQPVEKSFTSEKLAAPPRAGFGTPLTPPPQSWSPPAQAAMPKGPSVSDWDDDEGEETVLSMSPPLSGFPGLKPPPSRLGPIDMETVQDSSYTPHTMTMAEGAAISPEVAASYLQGDNLSFSKPAQSSHYSPHGGSYGGLGNTAHDSFADSNDELDGVTLINGNHIQAIRPPHNARTTATQPDQQQAKKSKTWIVMLVLLLLLAFGAGAALYFFIPGLLS